jgi:hypothetical protein
LSPISECSDVLQVDVSGSKNPYSFSDVEPDPRALTLDALSLSGVADVLARETGRDGGDALVEQCAPVLGPYVADVGGVGESVRHDSAGGSVDFRDDCDLVARQGFNGNSESAVPGAEFQDRHTASLSSVCVES